MQARLDPISLSLGVVWVCLCSLLLCVRTHLVGVCLCVCTCVAISEVFDAAMGAGLGADYNAMKHRHRQRLRSWLMCGLYSIGCMVLGLLQMRSSTDKLSHSHTFALMTLACGYYSFDLYCRVYHQVFNHNALTFLLTFENAVLLVGFITCLSYELIAPLESFFLTSAPHMLLVAARQSSYILGWELLPLESWKFMCWLTLRFLPHVAIAFEVALSPSIFPSMHVWLLALTGIFAVLVLDVLFISADAQTFTQANPVVPKKAEKSVDELWLIHGRYYDLEPFLNRHPGGAIAISLARGRDCTAMFESYHPFTDAHYYALAKYYSSTPERTENPDKSFHTPPKTLPEMKQFVLNGYKDEFYDVLRARVKKEMNQGGWSNKASISRKLYYIVVAVLTCASYRWYLNGSLLGALAFALFGWLVGAAGHDGGHFSISSYPIVNHLCSLGMSVLCSPVMWMHQHTYAHHSFTNQLSNDPDLHHFPWLRTHVEFEHKAHHNLQKSRWYVYAWYTLVVFGEAIFIPIRMLQMGSIHGITKLNRMSAGTYTGLVIHWVCYCLSVLVAPFALTHPSIAARQVIVFLTVIGLMFGFNSQINHLNLSSMDRQITRSWAREQVETSNNFCTNSYLAFILANGLNFQIEHHLFPGMNHEHLHKIAPVVRDTCEQFNVSYKNYDSVRTILNETAHYMKVLSEAPVH